MLPSLKKCRNCIRTFDLKYPHSTFDEFWAYKLKVETNGSILDSSHLNETARLLDEKLLRHPKWGLARLGIPPVEQIERILKNIRPEYDIIRNIALGEGRIVTNKKVTGALSLIYNKLCGITHSRLGDSPNSNEKSYIVGKSKVLMFIWGQTPGFDNTLRNNPALLPLPHLWPDERRYTPSEFRDILEKLDQWVVAWNARYKPQGTDFQSLSSLPPNRPVGRIIDMIYLVC